jgi:hypothetical protein
MSFENQGVPILLVHFGDAGDEWIIGIWSD